MTGKFPYKWSFKTHFEIGAETANDATLIFSYVVVKVPIEIREIFTN